MKPTLSIVALVVLCGALGCSPDAPSRQVVTGATKQPDGATAEPGPAGGGTATTAREAEKLVPAVAVTPDMPLPGKPGSVGICPDNSYQYVPNTGMCKPR